MLRIEKERLFHLVLALAITVSVYWGFTYTYISDMLAGDSASELPIAVHVHGISFLTWYALLAIQAVLVIARPMRLHRWLGYCSIPLAILMIATGLLVIGVRMDGGLYGDDQFWSAFSLTILSNLVLFAAFYCFALLKRNRPDQHRRLIIVAAATGSGAAIFRIFATLIGPGFYAVPTGILATNLFLIAGAIGDKLILGKVHRVYLFAIPIAVVAEVALLGLAFTEIGVQFQHGMVELLRPFFWLY